MIEKILAFARRFRTFGVLFGTVVEYYDCGLYGFSAAVLATKFFPGETHVIGLQYMFAVYAVAYFSKPIGAVLFGLIGDIYGRKLALNVTIIGVAVPTFAIGLLPDSYLSSTILMAILVVCRMLQGIFSGGEYDGAAVYVIEHSETKDRYKASSCVRFSGVLGLLLSAAVVGFFNALWMPSWGWRVPFLLSLPLAAATVYCRQFVQETPGFISSASDMNSTVDMLTFMRKNWPVLLVVALVSGSFGVTYQVSVVFMKQYLTILAPHAQFSAGFFSALTVLVFGLSMVFAGFLADKFGLFRVLKTSIVSTLLAVAVMIASIRQETNHLTTMCALCLAASVAPLNGLAHGVIAPLFRVKERYRGVAIGHSVGSLVMSGTANYVCLRAIERTGLEFFPLLYICLVSTVFLYLASTISGKAVFHEN